MLKIPAVFRLTMLATLYAGLACGRRPAPDADAQPPAARTSSAIALGKEGMLIDWVKTVVPDAVRVGASVPVTLDIRNVGSRTWPAADSAPEYTNGSHAVRISERWCQERGNDCPGFLSRHNLLQSLPPGETQSLTFVIAAPATPGFYELQFDVLQELVDWFSNRGSQRLAIRVRVE